MKINYQQILDEIRRDVSPFSDEGKVADFIPELALVNPAKFGIHLITTEGERFSIGDADEKFSIQSISKVLSLSLAFRFLGEKIWERVGVEPSGNAFNSLDPTRI